MNDLIKNLKLEVIATYNSDDCQEMFRLEAFTPYSLKSESHVIKLIKRYLKHPKKLVKLSLCWLCDKSIVDEYKTIHTSVFKNNGKYYFNNGNLLKN